MVSTSSDYERFQVKGINYEYMQYTQMYKFVAHIVDLKDFETLHGVANIPRHMVNDLPETVLANVIAMKIFDDLKSVYGERLNA